MSNKKTIEITSSNPVTLMQQIGKDSQGVTFSCNDPTKIKYINIGKTNSNCNNMTIETNFKTICENQSQCTIKSNDLSCDGYDTIINYACVNDIGKNLITNEELPNNTEENQEENMEENTRDNDSIIKNQEDISSTHNIIIQEEHKIKRIHKDNYFDCAQNVWTKYKVIILTIIAFLLFGIIIYLVYMNFSKERRIIPILNLNNFYDLRTLGETPISPEPQMLSLPKEYTVISLEK